MKIIKAVYKTSAVDKKGIIIDDVPEFAFVGRSNVGKSSLINALVGQKRLAKTSQTAGLTKMVNYFDINDSFRLVDLPGYGYAKVGKGQLNIWASLMSDYLSLSKSLLTVFVLLDVRILPTQLDQSMLEYLIFNKIPFRLVATKCDKLSKSAVDRAVTQIADKLKVRKNLIICTSGVSKKGVDELLNFMGGTLEAYGEDRT